MTRNTLTVFTALTLLGIYQLPASAAGEDPSTPAGEQAVDAAEAKTVAKKFFDLLKGEAEFGDEHVVSWNKEHQDIALAELKKLNERFGKAGQVELFDSTIEGDFSLSVIVFEGKIENPAMTTPIILMREKDGWKYLDEENFTAEDALKFINEQQVNDLRALLEWAKEWI